MKTVLFFASLATSVLSQGINILQPPSGFSIPAGAPFMLELQQENYIQPIQQGTITVRAGGALLYSGPFNPVFHSTAPERGMYQDFYLNMAELPEGLAVLDVQHDFQIVSAAGPQATHNNASMLIIVR